MKCETSWPKDSSFWTFHHCKVPADRICLEHDRRVYKCANHGKFLKLVAMIDPSLNVDTWVVSGRMADGKIGFWKIRLPKDTDPYDWDARLVADIDKAYHFTDKATAQLAARESGGRIRKVPAPKSPSLQD